MVECRINIQTQDNILRSPLASEQKTDVYREFVKAGFAGCLPIPDWHCYLSWPPILITRFTDPNTGDWVFNQKMENPQ